MEVGGYFFLLERTRALYKYMSIGGDMSALPIDILAQERDRSDLL